MAFIDSDSHLSAAATPPVAGRSGDRGPGAGVWILPSVVLGALLWGVGIAALV